MLLSARQLKVDVVDYSGDLCSCVLNTLETRCLPGRACQTSTAGGGLILA
jgi:hypothetical protein